jgi:hypothetical protein
MNENSEETCRLCGEITKEENLIMNMKDDCGGISFQQFIEYYCRFDMGEFRISNAKEKK